MVEIKLYKFSKDRNSTRTPGTANYTISGLFYGQTNILNPAIVLDMNYESNSDKTKYESMRECNYAFIASLGDRYYFIRNWTFDGKGKWIVDLEVDVLATYRQVIGNSEQYIVRSSAERDYNIVDNFYPFTETSMANNYAIAWGNSITGNLDISNCDFVFAFVSKNANTPVDGRGINGGVYYYVGMYGAMIQVMRSMSDINTFGERNYLQYCINAFALPYVVPVISGSERTSFCAGPDEISIAPYELSIPKIYNNIKNTVYLQFPNHPQQAQHGIWLNKAENTKMVLRFPAFGDITLNPDLYYKPNTSTGTRGCWVTVEANPGTGDATLSISDNNGNITNRLYGNIALPIYLSSSERNIINIASNYISMGTSIASSAINSANTLSSAGNIVQSAGGILNGIKHPETQFMRGQGGLSMAYLNGRIDVICEFQHIGEKNPGRMGYSLNKLRRVNELSANGGFMSCRLPHVHSAKMLSTEQEQIESYMAGGFYYE